MTPNIWEQTSAKGKRYRGRGTSRAAVMGEVPSCSLCRNHDTSEPPNRALPRGTSQ